MIGKINPVFGLPARKRIAGQIMRVGQVVGIRQKRPESRPIIGNATRGNAAIVHPVITSRAPDEDCARGFAARVEIGAGDFYGGVGAFRAGICKKGLRQIGRSHSAQSIGEVKGEGVGYLQIGGVIEHAELVGNCGGDFGSPMAGIDTP